MTSGLRIRIAGAGGQGVVLAGVMLAEAAVSAGLNATQSQAYGPQSRGGASRSDVIIAEGDIGFPRADALDVLVAMTEAARAAYQSELAPAGLLIVDDGATAPPTSRWVERHLPITATAEVVGSRLAANVVALGALWQLTRLVPFAALEDAVGGHVPPALRPLNLAALAAGVRIAEAVGVTHG